MHLYIYDLQTQKQLRKLQILQYIIVGYRMKLSSLATFKRNYDNIRMTEIASWSLIASCSWACISLKICPVPDHKISSSMPLLPETIGEIWCVDKCSIELLQVYGGKHTDCLHHGLVRQLKYPWTKITASGWHCPVHQRYWPPHHRRD